MSHKRKPRKTAFVKVSGDLATNQKFIAALQKLTQQHFVVVCVGGGTQINAAFKKAGYEVGKHGPLGRETKGFKERQLARDILEENQAELQDELHRQSIIATVIIPVMDIGSVLCHINGDQMVNNAYIAFDEVYIATTEDRREKKAQEFSDRPKVKVLGFD